MQKERAKKTKLNSFNQSDLIQAYLAYMANSPMVDNKKIIQDTFFHGSLFSLYVNIYLFVCLLVPKRLLALPN